MTGFQRRVRAVEQAIHARGGHVQLAPVAAFLRTLSDTQLSEPEETLSQLSGQGVDDDLMHLKVNELIQQWEGRANR